MNNRIGYGVFGTFGDPYGYQQAFYNGVDFKESLDLDNNAIEFYPRSELYAVKRTFVDDVYRTCFCVYSFAREMDTERPGTFIGSCIVLQDGYAEAEYIYKVLQALHEDTISNDANFDDNTFKATQVHDIVVHEPTGFVAVSANVIPITKTPFYSTRVEGRRKYLVMPEPRTTGNKEAQVIAFFDLAFKYYNDTGTLYFSFDQDVSEFASKKGIVVIKDWSEFASRKYAKQPTNVVRTKKGIQKLAGGDITIERNSYILASSEMPTGDILESAAIKDMPTGQTDDDDTDLVDDEEDDPYKPFDLWEEPVPTNGWTADEVKYKMKEYNRLFRYTNSLIDQMNGPARRRRRGKNSDESNGQETAPGKPNKNRKTVMALLLLGIVVFGAVAVYFLSDDDGEKPPVSDIMQTSSTAQEPAEDATQDADTLTAAELPNNVPGKETVTPQATVRYANRDSGKMAPVAKSPASPQLFAAKPATEAPSNVLPAADGTEDPDEEIAMPATKTKELHPLPNLELTQNDVMALRQAGVKNKTLSELAKLLFNNVPSNIGNIYKGQEAEYAALLLSNNRQVFRQSGSDYVCTDDNIILRIPAYKSPRLPVVAPK